MTDYCIRNATDRSGEHIDVVITDGEISGIHGAGEVDTNRFEPANQFDADGSLVTPTFSEPHTHLDTAMTVVRPVSTTPEQSKRDGTCGPPFERN